MSWSGYNTDPSNFNFQVEKYADPYAKIAGVGCAGTNQGYLASQSAYVEPPYIIGGKRSKSKRSKSKRSKSKRSKSKRSKKVKLVGGNSGYEFTNNPIAPVAGPGAPYSEVKGYNTLGNYRTVFPPLFKGASLTGGKKRTQYGCSKSGGARRSRGARRNRGARRSLKGGKKSRWTAKRHWTMRGGLSSASDYTAGRDTSQDQPYGNKAISFGQGLDTTLGANESALASPPPLLPYNDCGKVMRV